MKGPDFIIIGAAKSGTTSICRHLLDDDRLYLSIPKEPEFFARDDIYSKGDEWYCHLFDSAQSNQLCGEASTIYSLFPLFPKTAERMFSLIPNVKLIYVMRNPVNRAYSYYVQLMKNYQNSRQTTRIPVSFNELLFSKETCCSDNSKLAAFDKHLPFCSKLLTSGGHYYEQIQQYLRYYSLESIHFIIFEDFIANPNHELKKLYEFLNLDYQIEDGNLHLHRENISDDHFRGLYFLEQIKKIKDNKLLNKIINVIPSPAKKRLKIILFNASANKQGSRQFQPEIMTEDESKYLNDLYSESTDKLSELIGIDMKKKWGRS